MGHLHSIRLFNRVSLSAIAFAMAATFTACSDSSSSGTAGIFIETNTGNKQTARIMVSTTNLGISAGDTLVIHKETADTVGDIVHVSVVDMQRIADSLECVSGIMVVDIFPVGRYDSVQIHPIAGEKRSAAVDWEIAADTLNFDRTIGASFDGAVTLSLPQGFEDLAYANETFETCLSRYISKEPAAPASRILTAT